MTDSSAHARIQELEDENAWLRERLESFTGTAIEREVIRGELGLSRQQAAILMQLKKRQHGTHRDVLYSQVFEKLTGDSPCPKIVDVQVCKLRGRLRDRGAPEGISCAYGTATYKLTPELRAWIEGVGK